MSLLALVAATAAFVLILRLLRAAEVGGAVLGTARGAVATMRAPDLDDAAKEAAVRRASGRLFKGFLGIAGIGLAALGLPAALVWAGSAAGLYSLDEVAAIATGWPFLVASSIGATLAWIALERRRA